MLCLVRFTALSQDPFTAWEAVEHFSAALDNADGREIHHNELQLMAVFHHPVEALSLLSETLTLGDQEGFAISASLAQGIQSRATLASNLAGFTEGSIETLFELAGAATLQEVAISGKLSSIIKLAAPQYWPRFHPTRAPANSRVRSLFVMTPLRTALTC